MKTVAFEYKHMPSIEKWLAYRGHSPVSYWDLPKTGFIIPGVCAGFIRHVEGGYGILDSMVSNPLVSSSTRNKAMDTLFTQLMDAGPAKLLGTTQDLGTFERAIKHGFTQQHYYLLTKSKG